MYKILFFILFFSYQSFAGQNRVEILFNKAYGIEEKKSEIEEEVINNFNAVQVKESKQNTSKTQTQPLNKYFLEEYKSWGLLRATPNGFKTCYAIIKPTKRLGNINPNSSAYFMHHYFSKSKSRFIFFFDYTIKKGSKVIVSINGNSYILTPHKQYAFAESEEIERDVYSALKTSKKILIRAEGDDNKYSVDEYDVSHFQEVSSKLATACS